MDVLKRVFVLQVIEETSDEVKMEIYMIFTTRQKAKQIGENLVASNENNYIGYHISEHMLFQ